MQLHASASVRSLKNPVLTAIGCHCAARRNTKILHTLVGMGSAALAAAVASADPGKPTRISQLKGKKEVSLYKVCIKEKCRGGVKRWFRVSVEGSAVETR